MDRTKAITFILGAGIDAKKIDRTKSHRKKSEAKCSYHFIERKAARIKVGFVLH